MTSAYGWPMGKWMEEGIAFVARKNIIEYLKPAFLDDELTIATWLYDLKPASVVRHYEFSNSITGDLIAQLQTRWVMIDVQTRKPMKIPEFFRGTFASNIAISSAR